MNSKQALETITFEAKAREPIFNAYYQIYIEPIEKDLEVLDLLKNSIYNVEKHKRVLSEPIGEDFLIIGIHVNGNEQVNKILNWIKETNKNESSKK